VIKVGWDASAYGCHDLTMHTVTRWEARFTSRKDVFPCNAPRTVSTNRMPGDYPRDIKSETAYRQGLDKAAEGLFDVVDDVNRALQAVNDPATLEGLQQLRTKALRHFRKLGYETYCERGEAFDPHQHEAIAVNPSIGPENTICDIHRLGWKQEGRIVRVAVVTVAKGVTPQDLGDEGLGVHVRRRRRPPQYNYVCPYATPGCSGDCQGCRAAKLSLDLPNDLMEPPVLGVANGLSSGGRVIRR
jgi:hypothetical protein